MNNAQELGRTVITLPGSPVGEQPEAQAPERTQIFSLNTEMVTTPINSLAPKILTDDKDLERVQPYLELLKKTIDEQGITNIALTGNYGSGKSTIINTFQHQHDEYEYLRISLASFGNVTDEIAEVGNKEQTSINQRNKDNGENPPKPPGVVRKPPSAKKVSKEKKEELERLLEISMDIMLIMAICP